MLPCQLTEIRLSTKNDYKLTQNVLNLNRNIKQAKMMEAHTKITKM